MKLPAQSYIFSFIDKNAKLTDKVMKIIHATDTKDIVVLNNEMTKEIDAIYRQYRGAKNPVLSKMITAVNKGLIVLIYTKNPDYKLQTCYPFFKYKKDGKVKIAVDLTNYLTVRTFEEDNYTEYHIDVPKLYTLLYSAYLYLDVFDESFYPTAIVAANAATLWAAMFNNVLVKEVSLASNKDRYDAFMFFASKFFMMNYLEMDEKLADELASSKLKVGKTPLMTEIEDRIMSDGHEDFYTSFQKFCTCLFDNRYTSIQSIRVMSSLKKGTAAGMNISFFVSRFINMYDYSAILSLASFPYFIYTLMAAYNKTYINNSRAFEKIFTNYEKDYLRMINDLK